MKKSAYLKEIIEQLGCSATLRPAKKFHEAGWILEGVCDSVKCPECNLGNPVICVKPYVTPNGAKKRHWALICLICETVSNTKNFSSDQRKSLNKWSRKNSQSSSRDIPMSLEKSRSITLLEILNKKTTSTIEAISRFRTPGWTYQGCCYEVECFSCSGIGLDIWRRLINPEYENSFRYWGVFCRKCESLTDLSCYKAPQKKLLRNWASETGPSFLFNGEWTAEADKALLEAYQSGRTISSITEDFGMIKSNTALSDRLGNFLLFNKDFPIPFTPEPLEERESLELDLGNIWESCSQMPAREKTKVITNGICQWSLARGWSPSKEERIEIHSEICNSGRSSRRGRVDVWCEPKNDHKGLAIEIDGHDKVISISKLIQAGIYGYIPIWVRHTTPVKIDVPEQIHLISLVNNE